MRIKHIWAVTKQKIDGFRRFLQKHYKISLMMILALIVISGFAIIAANIQDWPDITGFDGKTIWDLADLLLIPLLLAVGALAFNWSVNKREQMIARNYQQETILETYFEQMKDLLLERRLKETTPNDELRVFARTLTLTALRRLDGLQKGILLQFLYEAELINVSNPIVNLREADLEEVRLSASNLSRVNLDKANLKRAHLDGTNLSEASIRYADLSDASLMNANLAKANFNFSNLTGANLHRSIAKRSNLSHTILENAILSQADLQRANLSEAQLSGSNLLRSDLEAANLKKAHLGKKVCLTIDYNENNLNVNRTKVIILNAANLSKANLIGTDFTGANFVGVDDSFLKSSHQIQQVSEVKLDGAKADGTTKWPSDVDIKHSSVKE